MNIVAIIPARMASTRFPGKPLAPIAGMPMIGHVYFRCKMAQSLSDVFIATCDEEIVQFARVIGAGAIMTSDRHQRASDRAAEAMLKIESMQKKKIDIVVMVQGDEPMIRPEMIDAALAPLLDDSDVLVSNLMAELESPEEENDPNEVKVVVDRFSDALYFSREPIPSRKKGEKNFKAMKQVCIIPFRRDFLLTFNSLSPMPLETIESVDMLRLLENGYTVRMVPTQVATYSVDIPEDLQFVETKIAKDPLLKRYNNKAKAR